MSRQIRVFLSSTFADMQAEREILLKRVFPGLRRRCRDRGVDLVEVDLRWGITEAQAERGEVMPVCIKEIDRCRPYFVALLGDRYGTVPETLPTAPWAQPGASMTHMEIRWAALRPGVRTDRAFFFFRRGTAGPEPQERLKADIRAHGLAVQDYDNPEDLAAQTQAALERAIDLDYPNAAAPSWLELEREAMAAFQQARIRIYVPRPAWSAQLDERGSVLVTGASGSGKSALLAHWAAEAAGRTFVHFCGASPRSAHAERIVLRLLAELGEPPEDPEDHVAAVAPCLAAAAPVVLVLDAIEHLDDLAWLPDPLPDGVRLIASGLPSPALDQLARRDYRTLTLGPLTLEERRQILIEALARYGKALNDERLTRIAAAPQTESPLFIRALADELRLWGDHDALDQPIDRMLAAPDVPGLFALILERLERDYESDHPGLVGQALSAIAAARRGLTEPELLAVTGAAPLAWAPLHHALDASLISRVGILTFFHDALRRAVTTRYLPDDDALTERRRALIRYFEAEPADARVAEELPWLQHQIGDQAGLTKTLSNLDIFLRMQVESELTDLAAWWRAVDGDPASAYRDALAAFSAQEPDPVAKAGAAHRVALFLQLLGRLDDAIPLFEQARGHYREAYEADDARLNVITNDYGLALFIAGRLRDAEPQLRKALELSGEVPGILHNLAEILIRKSENAEAEKMAQRAVDAFRTKLGRHEMTATALQNVARARMELGDLDGADHVLSEALGMVEGPPTRALALGLSNLGNLRLRQGRLQDSESLLRRSISISRSVLGPNNPHAAGTLSALAGTLFFAGREKEAEEAYRESIDLIDEHLGHDHPHLITALVALANLHLRRNEPEPADAFARRALAIAERELGPDSADAANAVQSLAACAASRGRYDEAAELALRAGRLHESLLGPSHVSTTRSWSIVSRLGQRLLEAHDPQRAEPLLRASLERTERHLGDKHPQVGPDLWNLAQALVELGQPAQAIPYFERELALLESSKGPEHPETITSRNNLETVRAAARQADKAT